LASTKTDFVSLLKLVNEKYFAILPNRGTGYEVEINETIFNKIIENWEGNNIVLLNVNGGQIIGNNLIVNSLVNVLIEENDTFFFN
jgi:hypothetical protein